MKLTTRGVEEIGFWKSLLLDVTIKGGALSKGDLAAFGSALHRCGNELDGAQCLLEALPVGSAARARAEDIAHSAMETYVEASGAYMSALNRRNDRIKQELSIIKPESERLNPRSRHAPGRGEDGYDAGGATTGTRTCCRYSLRP